jgi:hypothetical protein
MYDGIRPLPGQPKKVRNSRQKTASKFLHQVWLGRKQRLGAQRAESPVVNQTFFSNAIGL